MGNFLIAAKGAQWFCWTFSIFLSRGYNFILKLEIRSTEPYQNKEGSVKYLWWFYLRIGLVWQILNSNCGFCFEASLFSSNTIQSSAIIT